MENYNKRLAGIFYLGMILFGMFAQITRSNVFAFDNINILEKIKNSILILRFIVDINKHITLIYWKLKFYANKKYSQIFKKSLKDTIEEFNY